MTFKKDVATIEREIEGSRLVPDEKEILLSWTHAANEFYERLVAAEVMKVYDNLRTVSCLN